MTGPSLDDLPRYSPWPARLLGLAPWSQREKTRAEILREYENEKWAPTLERFRSERAAGKPVGLDAVDAWLAAPPTTPILATLGPTWTLSTAADLRTGYLDLIATTLLRYAPTPREAVLVELGAGYGSALLRLVRAGAAFEGASAHGLDVCPSGLALMRELAAVEGARLVVGACDLADLAITTEPLPPDAIVFTSYATSCVPTLGAAFVDRVRTFRPRVVVHFEPFHEHAVGDDLLSLMRRRYIELNGYDRTFLTVLRDQHARGSIEIVEEVPNAFGANPLFAASVVAWRPRS